MEVTSPSVGRDAARLLKRRTLTDADLPAVKRVAASAGDGTVALTPGEAGDNRFFRLKFVAEEE